MSINYKYILLITLGCVFFLAIILSGALNSAIDFAPLYYSSQIFSDGGDIYNFDLLREVIIGQGHSYSAIHYLYPPFLSAIIQPLGQLPLTTALIIWLIINTAALIISLGLLINKFFPGKIKYYLIILAGLLIYYPATINLQLGQVNPIVFLLLCGGIILLFRQKNIGAGILLGIATLLKVFPIFFLIYALLTKRFKIFFSGLLTIIGGVLLTMVIAGMLGLESYLNYINSVIPVFFTGELPNWFPGTMAPGFFDILWTTTEYTWLISLITKSLAILFFGFMGYKYSLKKIKTSRTTTILEISFISVLLIVTSSVNYHHYLIFLMIPLLLLYHLYLNNKKRYLLIWLIISFVLSAIPPFFTKYLLPTYVNNTIYPFINPGLWSVVIVLILITTQYFKESTQNK